MAKHRRRRNSRRRFTAIPFEASISPSTLADNTAIAQDILSAQMADDFYAISVDSMWSIDAQTAGEGPLHVGFAHNDLSVTEIAETLLCQLTDPSDIINRERSRRPVRRVGLFPAQVVNETLNDGVEKRTPLRFQVGDGHQLEAYVMNRSNAALSGGSRIDVAGTLYGKWL